MNVEILTPEKKFMLADELKKELDSLNKTIAIGGISAGQKQAIEASKAAIQKVGKAKGYQYVINAADLLLADGPDLTADVKKDLGF